VWAEEASAEQEAQILDSFTAEDALVWVCTEAYGVEHGQHGCHMLYVLLKGVTMDQEVVYEAGTEAS
jgi:hypothetical protein